ncbi:uncharacterized protein LOC118345276 [Juglans regia]|uniref:Uncharacterized protein LOC118345276 n=1 Tax=Juglans regia TaxID=51240 RepID=A0A6P9EJA2_JUGRE|nr:uncharacterized protein LOC118345276 [Juglans regia]
MIPSPSSADIFKDPDLRVSDLILEDPRRWNFPLLQVLFSASTENIPTFWKMLWSLKVQDRLKLMVWKIFCNILPTRSLLKSCLSLSNDQALCPICLSAEETTTHLFLECPFSRILWRKSPWPVNIDTLADHDIFNWIKIILDPSVKNQVTHSSSPIHTNLFITRALSVYHDHKKAWAIKFFVSNPNWIPPSINQISIAFDVAVRDSGSTATAVFRDHLGNFLGGVTEFSPMCNPNGGEALAAFIGIKVATEKNWPNIIIEGDSQVVISALNNPLQQISDWTIEGRIRDMKVMLSSFVKWEAVKIHRT